MRKWKQIGAFALAAVLTVLGPAAAWAATPEFGRTAEEWAKLRDNVMEYNELAGLVHEYNVTVQNNQRDYNENKNKTSEEIAQDLRDQADSIRSTISGEDDAGSIMSDSIAESSAKQLENQADDVLNDSETLLLTYQQTEATLVSTAQTNMIAYHQNILELELLKKQKELLQVTYESTQARLAAGMATQMDVLGAQENLLNAEAAILTAQSQLDNTKQKLCVMLGWSFDASPVIQGIPAADLSRIDSMNPSADKAKAIENNYTLKINKKKKANAYSSSTEDSLTSTIKDNEQKIGTSLTAVYKGVTEAKNAYDQAVTTFAMETKNMEAAERKYQLGSISRLEYISQQFIFAQKQIGVQTAELNLFQAMESYDWAVNGLAGA